MIFIEILQTIKNAITFLDTWESEVKNLTIAEAAFLSKDTAEGLRVTLQSTLDIIHLLHRAGYKYVLTAKVNQDKLEVSFVSSL